MQAVRSRLHRRLPDTAAAGTQEQPEAILQEFDSALDSLTPENQTLCAELVNMVVYLAQANQKKVKYVFRQLDKAKVPYCVLGSPISSFEQIPGKLKIVCKTEILKMALHKLAQKIEVSPQMPLQ